MTTNSEQQRVAVAERLRRFYAESRGHFGYAETWWPGTPLELTLTAVLVQQCDWSTAWAAVGRLREAELLDIPRLAGTTPGQLRTLLHPVAYAPTKAGRLIHLAASLLGQGFSNLEPLLDGDGTEQVRRRLLQFVGIGPETADCILLFAASRHATFVVDASARRVLQRLALPSVPDAFWGRSYEELRQFLLRHIVDFLPLYDDFELAPGVPRTVALLRDFHAQIVELGKHHCLKKQPLCHARGKSGWKDYFFCRTHCDRNHCARCPLAALCTAAGPP